MVKNVRKIRTFLTFSLILLVIIFVTNCSRANDPRTRTTIKISLEFPKTYTQSSLIEGMKKILSFSDELPISKYEVIVKDNAGNEVFRNTFSTSNISFDVTTYPNREHTIEVEVYTNSKLYEGETLIIKGTKRVTLVTGINNIIIPLEFLNGQIKVNISLDSSVPSDIVIHSSRLRLQNVAKNLEMEYESTNNSRTEAYTIANIYPGVWDIEYYAEVFSNNTKVGEINRNFSIVVYPSRMTSCDLLTNVTSILNVSISVVAPLPFIQPVQNIRITAQGDSLIISYDYDIENAQYRIYKKYKDENYWRFVGSTNEKTYSFTLMPYELDKIELVGVNTIVNGLESGIATKEVSPNNPPAEPSNPNPVNGATDILNNTTLSWSCSDPDGDNLIYDVYFGTSTNPPLTKSNYTGSSYNPGILNYNTTYYWKIVAKDGKGGITEGPVWSFVTRSVGTFKWRYQTGGDIWSCPAIDEYGTIYVGSYDKYLYAINPDGSQKWRYLTGGSIRSSPTVGSDGTIYVGSEDSYIYAINQNGSLKWKYQTGGPIYSSPAIGNDGTIYIGSDDKYLYAINSNGSLKWKYQTGGQLFSSPAISNDETIYIGSTDKYLYAINSNGLLKWKYQTGGPIYSSPAIGNDGTIYIGSDDKYLYAINSNGSLKWKYQTGGSIVNSSPAIGTDGTVYVGSDNYCLYAISPDGKALWAYPTGGQIWSSPAIGIDGTIYVGSTDSRFYAIKPDGKLKWEFQTGNSIISSAAISADGIVYIGSHDDYLYAIYSDSYGLVNSSWPKFRQNNKNTGRQ